MDMILIVCIFQNMLLVHDGHDTYLVYISK